MKGAAGLGGLGMRLLAPILSAFSQVGTGALFAGRCAAVAVRPPFRLGLIMQHAEFIGFGSLFIVCLTGLFTGAVFTLQSVHALAKMGVESMVGSTVWLACSRELGPVLSSLMVCGRVGSAMATELGTMRVSEQIDAMEVMAVDPVQYLVVPRLWAALLMAPCMCIIFDAVAAAGSYIVAVWMLAIDEGAYIGRIGLFVQMRDFLQGMAKSAVFGLAIALIGCFKGFSAKGGARGVGQATTQTVVAGSIAIFLIDYLMTSIFLRQSPG